MGKAARGGGGGKKRGEEGHREEIGGEGEERGRLEGTRERTTRTMRRTKLPSNSLGNNIQQWWELIGIS